MSKKGPRPVQKTPQEKKRLSLLKDRRNSYGENDKALRKLIPLRKAQENRHNRRKVSEALTNIDKLNEEQTDTIESTARQDVHRVGGWRKAADVQLGKILEIQKAAATTLSKAARRAKQLAFQVLLKSKGL